MNSPNTNPVDNKDPAANAPPPAATPDPAASAKKPMRIGDKLIELGLISKDQLQIALLEQKTSKKLLGAILVETGFAPFHDGAEGGSGPHSEGQHGPAPQERRPVQRKRGPGQTSGRSGPPRCDSRLS